MSKIRTLSDLSDAIDSEFAWRKKELHTLLSAVRDNKTTKNRDMHIRSAIALLYAHWEGLIKKVGTHYLEFVYRQRLRNFELAPEMLALSAGQVVTAAMVNGKTAARRGLAKFCIDEMSEKCQFNWSNAVQTKANLSSAVLREIVGTVGLDYGPFESKEKLLDERLLSNRNHIAHGHYLVIGVDDYIELHTVILDMMDSFVRQIFAAANTGMFRSRPATTSAS